MTHEKIRELQIQGFGYKKISKLLCLPENTVKSYIKRHPLHKQYNYCLKCGAQVSTTKHKKQKKFCSDRCRMDWWNTHLDQVNRKTFKTFTCLFCGDAFQSYGNKKRKYCSRACFADARRKVV